MATRVLSRQEMKIDCEDDVLLVRRRVQMLAQQRGFDPFATAALTTATSELTRNVWIHAGRGQAVVEEIAEGGRCGIRVQFRDEGPGIADIERALRGGYSTAGSLGLGLSGSRRLVDHLNIESAPGRGTVVTILKWARLR
ncbi:MAG: ATP-binding protein [Myxococcales bacterium]|nr:ATP-binding protein [Myxococcota bacterium]MDW8281285.1 ATP-binding protein [Myxococcales bacterium]